MRAWWRQQWDELSLTLWIVQYYTRVCYHLSTRVLLGLPLMVLGLSLFLAEPLSAHRFVAMLVLCMSAGKLRQCFDAYHDVNILRGFKTGWHQRFSPVFYDVVPSDQVDQELIDTRRIFKRTHFDPAILVTRLGPDAKWPTAWMTYQFRGMASLICVDTAPNKMTPLQRLILLHEIGHSLFAHGLNANLAKEAVVMLPTILLPSLILAAPLSGFDVPIAGAAAVIVVASLWLTFNQLPDVTEEISDEFAINHFLAFDGRSAALAFVQKYIDRVVPIEERANRQEHFQWVIECLNEGMGTRPYLQPYLQWALKSPFPFVATAVLWCAVVFLGTHIHIYDWRRIFISGFVTFVVPTFCCILIYRSFDQLAASCGLHHKYRYTGKGKLSVWAVRQDNGRRDGDPSVAEDAV
jgi:hypothetical protein